MTDKPPVCWTGTREAIYLSDTYKSRRVVINCLRNGLQPGDIDEFDCPRIRNERYINPLGPYARNFWGGLIQVMVSKSEDKMSSLDGAASPGLDRLSVTYIRPWRREDCIIPCLPMCHKSTAGDVHNDHRISILAWRNAPGPGSVHGHRFSAP